MIQFHFEQSYSGWKLNILSQGVWYEFQSKKYSILFGYIARLSMDDFSRETLKDIMEHHPEN